MTHLPKRKNPRLSGYDYADHGSYFITICTKDRACLFWKTSEQLSDQNQIQLSNIGHICMDCILNIPKIYPTVSLDTYCVMHDHIHLLLTIQQHTEPSVSIPKFISQLKGIVSKKSGSPIWQRDYYDHIIRDEEDYNQKYQYIENNPINFILKHE